MAAALRNVILLGGAGTLGPSIIAALQTNGNFEISVLSRPGSKSTFAPGVSVIKSDFSKESLEENFAGQDAVVDLLGQASLHDRKKIIDAAVEAGIKRFIISEFSLNMENEKNVAALPFFAQRVTVREYAKEKASQTSSFSYSVVANGLFYDWALKTSFSRINVKDATATIWGDENQAASVTTLSSVGKAVEGILSKPSETTNKSLFIASFSPSQREILDALEEQTGKRFTITRVSIADALAQGYEALDKGEFSGIVPLLLALNYSPENGNHFSKDAVLSNELLGLPVEDLVAVTRAVVAEIGV